MFSHVDCARVCVFVRWVSAPVFPLSFYEILLGFFLDRYIDMFISNAQNIFALLYYKIEGGNWERISLPFSTSHLSIPSSIHHIKILSLCAMCVCVSVIFFKYIFSMFASMLIQRAQSFAFFFFLFSLLIIVFLFFVHGFFFFSRFVVIIHCIK